MSDIDHNELLLVTIGTNKMYNLCASLNCPVHYSVDGKYGTMSKFTIHILFNYGPQDINFFLKYEAP
jgi:hypothetical protein